jgi:FAD:protein FMN transferase
VTSRWEHRFSSMGTWIQVLIVAPTPDALTRVEALVHDREARWSRFRPDSELSRCNAAGGAPVLVSAETAKLIARAVDAWAATAGRFDPTVGGPLRALGYDRPLDGVREGPARDVGAPSPSPGGGAVEVDARTGWVRLAPGTSLDLGGIAKGHTVDTVVEALQDEGSRAAV